MHRQLPQGLPAVTLRPVPLCRAPARDPLLVDTSIRRHSWRLCFTRRRFPAQRPPLYVEGPDRLSRDASPCRATRHQSWHGRLRKVAPAPTPFITRGSRQAVPSSEKAAFPATWHTVCPLGLREATRRRLASAAKATVINQLREATRTPGQPDPPVVRRNLAYRSQK